MTIMRTGVAAAVVLMGILAVLATPAAAQQDRRVIVIDTFENPADYYSSTIGSFLTDMFITGLSRASAFTVVDGRGGTPIEAKFYLGGKITDFSYDEELEESDSSRESSSETYQQTMNVRIDVAVVDDSSEIVFAEAVSHRETATSSSSMAAAYDRLVSSGLFGGELTSSLMGRATQGVVERAVERLTTYFEIMGPDVVPIESSIVALLDYRTAVIDRGGSVGLRAADELEVFREMPITNAAGEVVFVRRTAVGTAAVSEVQDDGALIAAAAGVELREGDIAARGAGSSPSDHIRKGDAFFEAGFYWATVREYRNALDLDAGTPVDHRRLGLAHMKAGNAYAAFESIRRFLAGGGSIEWSARHRHTFGSCTGIFTLTADSVSFRSPDEDDLDHWFEETPFAEIRRARHASRHTWGDGDLPFLEIRTASAEQIQKNEGDAKNWSFRFNLMGEHEGPADLVMRSLSDR